MATTGKAKDRMPVLFIGHGNPMNALERNEYTRAWERIAADLPRPRAILAVSAHWYTPGARVTAEERPRTIHDFGGFPRQLYEVQYPAAGSPELARLVSDLLAPTPVMLDDRWGLDHGTWSVLVHMFPRGDVPVVQLGIDETLTPEEQWDLAVPRRPLRQGGRARGAGRVPRRGVRRRLGVHARGPHRIARWPTSASRITASSGTCGRSRW